MAQQKLENYKEVLEKSIFFIHESIQMILLSGGQIWQLIVKTIPKVHFNFHCKKITASSQKVIKYRNIIQVKWILLIAKYFSFDFLCLSYLR